MNIHLNLSFLSQIGGPYRSASLRYEAVGTCPLDAILGVAERVGGGKITELKVRVV